jgi:hypothetical protein
MSKPKDQATGTPRACHRSVALCSKCELSPCQCGQWISVYRIDSYYVGAGPFHRTRKEAEDERKEMLSEDPRDRVRIVINKMKAEQYAALPEHQGY